MHSVIGHKIMINYDPLIFLFDTTDNCESTIS